jgi:hypothetical protein
LTCANALRSNGESNNHSGRGTACRAELVQAGHSGVPRTASRAVRHAGQIPASAILSCSFPVVVRLWNFSAWMLAAADVRRISRYAGPGIKSHHRMATICCNTFDESHDILLQLQCCRYDLEGAKLPGSDITESHLTLPATVPGTGRREGLP